MTRPDDSVPVLAAIVGRQTSDLSVYAGFLLEALSGSLPPDHLVVQRKRGFLGRVADDAPVLAVQVRLGDNAYRLARARIDAAPSASVAHVVSGIVLKTETVPIDVWSGLLAQALRDFAETNVAASDALRRITGFTV